MPLEELTDWCGMNAQPGSPVGEVARAVLQARVAQEGATQLVAATRKLVFATWVVVAATVVVAAVTALAQG